MTTHDPTTSSATNHGATNHGATNHGANNHSANNHSATNSATNSATRPGLEVHGLHKAYGDVSVLRGVDLTVAAGEVVGLLGANGAGKSTTNRIIAGLLRADEGRVTIAGHDVADAPEDAMTALGYMPEAPFLYPELSTHETLELICDLRALEGAPAWIDRTLQILDLAHAADRPVRALSQGMRRKLTLAVALVGDPPVLLLDEPTNGLDPPAVALFKSVLAELRRRGRAVLISSHILALLEPLCDRVAILEAGAVQACGTLAELRDRATLPGADLEALYLHFAGRERTEVAELFQPLAGVAEVARASAPQPAEAPPCVANTPPDDDRGQA